MVDMVTVGAQGRIVLPAATRAALGLSAGQRLTVTINGTSLVLSRAEDAGKELRRLGELIEPGRSLLDELLIEREAEASAE